MVLSTHKPYDVDSSGDDDDPWEMISEHETEIAPLADATAQNPTVVPDDGDAGDRQGEGDADAERESLLETDVLNAEVEEVLDEDISCASGVSSITGDHHTVSDVDVDEQVEEDGGDAENEGNALIDEEEQVPSEPAPSVDTAEEEEPKEGATSDPDPLVEQLSQMGFEKEQIKKTVNDMREAGVAEFDADSVIGSMVGEANNTNTNGNGNANPMGSTWDFVESTVQDFDNQHELRRRTQNCVRNVSRSAQELWSNARDESQRFKSNLRETCDQADVHAREAGTQVRYAASSAKDSFARANEDYGITEKLAAVAVIGGATLLALGNPRAGVGAMAVAGASLAAGEAMKNTPERRPRSAYPRDHGLPRGVHLD